MVELNVDTLHALKEQGIDAVYGDATRPKTLASAGLDNAGTLILTSAGMENRPDVIRNARELNPDVRVLARAAYLRDLTPCTTPAPTTSIREKAKSRSHSSKTSWATSARRLNR